MKVQFPVKCELSIYLTDGENWATAGGPEISGDVADKAGAITAIAAAMLAVEQQTQLKGWRLPTPDEFLKHVIEERTGVRFAVPKQPLNWPGFTQAELETEIERLRSQGKDRDDEDYDDE